VAQRIIDAEIEDDAEEGHARQRDQERQPVGPAEIDGEHHHQIGGHHGELALGEIHHIGRAEDQHEAERHQRVDGADADAREEKLQGEIHDRLMVRGAAGRQWANVSPDDAGLPLGRRPAALKG
jgi:hypothetical protein